MVYRQRLKEDCPALSLVVRLLVLAGQSGCQNAGQEQNRHQRNNKIRRVEKMHVKLPLIKPSTTYRGFCQA